MKRRRGSSCKASSRFLSVARLLARRCGETGLRRLRGGLAHPCFTPSQKYGACRAEEVAFYRRWLAASRCAHDASPLSFLQLEALSPAVGYVLRIHASTQAFLNLYSPVPLAANEQHRVETFVLSTLNSMLDIARVFPHYSFPEEKRWVSTIEMVLAELQRSEFVTALRAGWTAAPFQAMLRARGLSNARDEDNTCTEVVKARALADIAAHGLHPCGLPSCDQREVSVKQFKYCGDCEAEWYCCAEHQVLHWKEHKPICRARAATAALGAVTLD